MRSSKPNHPHTRKTITTYLPNHTEKGKTHTAGHSYILVLLPSLSSIGGGGGGTGMTGRDTDTRHRQGGHASHR